jgi:hypothetical protein
MSHRALSVLALLSGCWLTCGAALAESRIALVIGNSSYETVSVLPNPANDAKAMTELLKDAGFEVVQAANLSQSEMRQALSNFAGIAAAKGPDTVTLVFYAGHGLQVDGSNFLVPVDARIQREADVPLQAMRLADLMNILTDVPSKLRIVILDACRNNPFSEINKTTGRGLAIVDAPTGSLVSYSTAPGTEAQDGDGANSPYTAALVKIAREPGLPIEQALKRVRASVHNATGNQQTPWESSSLTSDFFFFPAAGAVAGRTSPGDIRQASAVAGAGAGAAGTRTAARSVDSWRREFRSRQPAEAYNLVIEEGTPEAFEAYLAVYTVAPYAPRVRSLLERRREMIAWYEAVTLNTVASYQAFLARYADSDLATSARRLMLRASMRALASIAPTCPCALPPVPPPAGKKARNEPKKKKEASRSPKERTSKRNPNFVSDAEVGRGPPPTPVGGAAVAPSGPPISIGIGIPIRGGGMGGPIRGGGHSGGPVRTGPTHVPTRPMGGQHVR